MTTDPQPEPTAPAWFSPKVRAWLYGIAAAVVPLLVLLGALSDAVGQYVLNIAAAILAVGSSTMAMRHVNR